MTEPTIGKFAYSFDRETFRGAYEARQQAVDAAVAAAQELLNPPEAVYSGQREMVDPCCDGHAEALVDAVRRRVSQRHPDQSSGFLTRVNEHQLAELDEAIERALKGWLAKHNLGPHFDRIVRVTEHPVPLVRGITGSREPGLEVGELGESQDF